jgi:hypothetical protein
LVLSVFAKIALRLAMSARRIALVETWDWTLPSCNLRNPPVRSNNASGCAGEIRITVTITMR